MIWQGPESELGRVVEDQTKACLAVYAEDPSRVEQDTRIELEAAEGGYGRKQLFELIQNAADAMKDTPGPVRVVLTQKMLYISNAGEPFTSTGVRTLLASHLSRKSDEHIGQFGLGFKSVVAIADRVSVFSRTGSFEFDSYWAANRVRALGIDQPRYPLLRLARPIQPSEHAGKDQVLANLMDGAATVVRLPLTSSSSYASLAEDIERFPAAFLLFSHGVTELRLEDRSKGVTRTIRLDRVGDRHFRLTDNSDTTEWVVVSKTHKPSKAALADAGELNRRESVELSWAAPRGSAMRVGEFWAFFPTTIKTTLSGIINAPWKLSADRLTMIEGAFNEELLVDVLPEVVAHGVGLLHSDDDPAAMIDVLPARGREGRSWADDTINQPVIEAVASHATLPHMLGQPGFPKTLALHPPQLLPAWKEQWETKYPKAWVHHAVDRSAERRLKAQRLIEAAQGKAVGLDEWIASMAADKSPKSCASALALLRRIIEDVPSLRDEAIGAKVILLEDGRLVRAERGRVFLRAEGSDEDHDYIDPQLAGIAGVVDDLRYFGVEVLNPIGELRAVLQQRPSGPAWGGVWPKVRAIGSTAQALHILREELPAQLVLSMFAKVRSGKWRPLAECLLPGEILSPANPKDTDFLIDDRYHQPDLQLLEACGAVSSPRLLHGMPDEPWLRAFKSICRDKFREKVKQRGLSDERIVVEGPDLLWPLDMMSRLSDSARAAMTQKVMELSSPDDWTVFHTSNSSLPRQSAPNPASYWLRKHGLLQTSAGTFPVKFCLHPDADLHEVFPVAKVTHAWADALGLQADVHHWEDLHWRELIRHTEAVNLDFLPIMYGNAAEGSVPAPNEIKASLTPTSMAKFPPGRVAVTDSPSTHSSLLSAGIPSLLVFEDWQRDALIEQWGLADGRQMLKEETVAVPVGQPSFLTDLFPPLKRYHNEVQDMDSLIVQPCSTIDLLISTPNGQETRRDESHRDGSVINVQNGSPSQLLRRIGRALNLQLDVAAILEDLEQGKRNKVRAEILSETSLARKLVLAIGKENLRSRLPGPAIDELETAKGTNLSDEELAELALAVLGLDILRECRRDLEENGLEPPRAWAGSREARAFVLGLGFEVEYAGFPTNRPDAVEMVDGPARLPELHSYQRKVVDRIQHIVKGQGESTRGMVTLPTGAGKTRVAAQAVIELAAKHQFEGPVLWIAQNEELCEQAVQSWSFIWRALGNGPMTLSRFWDTYEVDQAPPGVFQVVIAGVDKLNQALDKPQYDWVKDVQLIIIDEAHSSITPSYTKVLQWISGESHTTRMTTPLLGLTATAYRGHSEVDTERLVGRYQHNKLDEGVFGDEDPYAYLQMHRVLATVRQVSLKGMEIEWTEEVGQHLTKFGSLPGEVEQQIGRNANRNRVILESILQQPDDWPILLFASSVQHARTMAAQLSYHGVNARPIDGTTDSSLRRRYVEQFRNGDIRVLTNYNVLTQGFDAPKVQAVYVARPTFSPNLYQQMIGRGLRGPLNGGSEEVLIVNVEDNIQKYGEQLAFHHFDHLWKGNK